MLITMPVRRHRGLGSFIRLRARPPETAKQLRAGEGGRSVSWKLPGAAASSSVVKAGAAAVASRGTLQKMAAEFKQRGAKGAPGEEEVIEYVYEDESPAADLPEASAAEQTPQALTPQQAAPGSFVRYSAPALWDSYQPQWAPSSSSFFGDVPAAPAARSVTFSLIAAGAVLLVLLARSRRRGRS